MDKNLIDKIEELGNAHLGTSVDTPMRADAFAKSDDEKIEKIQFLFQKIMEELGLDLTDDSLSGTPYRFAKMYVKELFYGLDPRKKPKLSSFKNKYGYNKMLIESNKLSILPVSITSYLFRMRTCGIYSK